MVGRHTNQHYGQTCCTIHRIYVDRKIADDFIDAQCEFFKELKIGHQAESGTQLGAVGVTAVGRSRVLDERALDDTLADRCASLGIDRDECGPGVDQVHVVDVRVQRA